MADHAAAAPPSLAALCGAERSIVRAVGVRWPSSLRAASRRVLSLPPAAAETVAARTATRCSDASIILASIEWEANAVIARQRIFDVGQVEVLFRTSELRATEFRSAKEGHAFSQHIGITNVAMARRGERVHDGGIVAITAFITNADTFLAAAELLNSAPGKAALLGLDTGHNGMRAGITYCATTPTRIRYLRSEAVFTMPSYWFRMVLDRNGVEPYGLHVQTFFPLLDPDAEVGAWVENSDGRGGQRPVFPFPLGRPASAVARKKPGP